MSYALIKRDKIVVLGDGCVEEVGTFKDLASDPNSRFSAFLKTMADTSRSTIEQVPVDADAPEEADEDDLSVDFNYHGDDPEGTKVIHDSPKRTLLHKASIIVTGHGNDAKGATRTVEH